jgi:hypothetical protein
MLVSHRLACLTLNITLKVTQHISQPGPLFFKEPASPSVSAINLYDARALLRSLVSVKRDAVGHTKISDVRPTSSLTLCPDQHTQEIADVI